MKMKPWSDIEVAFEDVCSLSCVPVNHRTYPEDYIFDEDASVRWNREEVARLNKMYSDEHNWLKEECNRRYNSVVSDILAHIQSDLDFHVTPEASKLIWDYAESSTSSGDTQETFNTLYQVLELFSSILKIKGFK